MDVVNVLLIVCFIQYFVSFFLLSPNNFLNTKGAEEETGYTWNDIGWIKAVEDSQ